MSIKSITPRQHPHLIIVREIYTVLYKLVYNWYDVSSIVCDMEKHIYNHGILNIGKQCVMRVRGQTIVTCIVIMLVLLVPLPLSRDVAPMPSPPSKWYSCLSAIPPTSHPCLWELVMDIQVQVEPSVGGLSMGQQCLLFTKSLLVPDHHKSLERQRHFLTSLSFEIDGA